MVRPRKRWGTVYGFSVVDTGGNWLRISRSGDEEPTAEDATPGLAGVVEVAARLADAHGDDAAALRTLEQGLSRHADAPAADRVRALLYRAELAVRVGDMPRARVSLESALEVDLGDDGRESVATDIEHVVSLLADG
jgi:uncharacterized protein HemY